jgi:hypothetical protein
MAKGPNVAEMGKYSASYCLGVKFHLKLNVQNIRDETPLSLRRGAGGEVKE